MGRALRQCLVVAAILTTNLPSCLAVTLFSSIDLPVTSGDLPARVRWLATAPEGGYEYADYSRLTSDGAVLALETWDHPERGDATRSLVYDLDAGRVSPVRAGLATHLGDWSPDEQVIPWASGDRGAHAAIGVIGRDGVTRTLLDTTRLERLSGLHLMDPKVGAWSRDGKWLLWGVDVGWGRLNRREGSPALGLVSREGFVPWTMNRQGLPPSMTTWPRCDLLTATASPSGAEVAIVFALRTRAAYYRADAPTYVGLVVVDMAGKVLRWRKLPMGCIPDDPVWTPDGSKLLLVGWEDVGGFGIDVLDASTLRLVMKVQGWLLGWAGNDPMLGPVAEDGRDEWRALNLETLKARPLLKLTAHVGWAVWLVGAKAALVSLTSSKARPGDREERHDLYLANLDTGERRMLSRDDPGYQAVSSHDGRYAAWLVEGPAPQRWRAGLHVLEVATGRELTTAMSPATDGFAMQWARTSNRLLVAEAGAKRRLLMIDLEQEPGAKG